MQLASLCNNLYIYFIVDLNEIFIMQSNAHVLHARTVSDSWHLMPLLIKERVNTKKCRREIENEEINKITNQYYSHGVEYITAKNHFRVYGEHSIIFPNLKVNEGFHVSRPHNQWPIKHRRKHRIHCYSNHQYLATHSYKWDLICCWLRQKYCTKSFHEDSLSILQFNCNEVNALQIKHTIHFSNVRFKLSVWRILLPVIILKDSVYLYCTFLIFKNMLS